MSNEERDLEMALELTDYQRSMLALGEAMIAASGAIAFSETNRGVVVRILERQLVQREALIDLLAADLAIVGLVGLVAAKSGRTARQILEEHFEHAPTDADWRRRP